MGMTDEDRRRLTGSGTSLEPLAASISDTSKVAGLSRSEIYRRLAAGDIRAVKSGNRTLIIMDSVREYLTSLPVATFRAPPSKCAA